jgi:hypothetical protein
MSLCIDIDQICDVLLSDGWHHVAYEGDKSTFCIDTYDFMQEIKGKVCFPVRGGAVAGVPSTGAQWLERENEKSYLVSCPLTAILAVKRSTPQLSMRAKSSNGDALEGLLKAKNPSQIVIDAHKRDKD